MRGGGGYNTRLMYQTIDYRSDGKGRIPVRKEDPPDANVCVDLDADGFHVVGAVSATREIGQIELDLVPAFG